MAKRKGAGNGFQLPAFSEPNPNMARQSIFQGICLVFAASLIFSRFLLTVCMIGFVALALFDWQPKKGFPLRWNPNLAKGFEVFRTHRALWSISLLFVIVLLGGLYNEDWQYYLERLRIKLPFLLLPLVFAILPTIDKRQYHSILYGFLWMCFLSCLGVLVNYLLHYDLILVNISRGQAMPTPINHIRYSLMLAFATLSGFVLYGKGFYWRFRWERWPLLLISLGLFGFLHFLSVRSGLIVLYLALGFLLLRYIYLTRRWRFGLGMMLLLTCLPYLAFQLLPSFRTKYYYARYDLEMYLRGEGESYSDSERLLSYQVGWKIFCEHPLIGVGAGDLRQEVAANYPPDSPHTKMPHNQLLSVMAGAGVLGLAVFLWVFFTPLFSQHAYRDPILLILHLVIFLSFLVENTIENAFGVAFYIFFLLLGWSHWRGTKK
ncbi:MAG: O-antigen ligase family protein [Bacteroidota bacterium]